MATLTPAQIAAVAYAAGFRNGAGYQGRGLTWAVAVALAESGGRVEVQHHNTNGSTDTGLWQINSIHRQYSAAAMMNALQNAKAAFAISSSGTNWRPWATFTNGAAGAQLGRAALAAPGAASGAGGAQDASFMDPLWPDNIDPFNLWPDDITGSLNPANMIGPLVQPITAIGHAAAVIASSWLKTAEWIATPHNWQRIAWVYGGVFAAAIGLWMLANSGIGGPVGGVARAAAKGPKTAGRTLKSAASAAATVAAPELKAGSMAAKAGKAASTAGKTAKTAAAAAA